jgi:hypothetical protein
MKAARAFAIVLLVIITLFVILPSLIRPKSAVPTHQIPATQVSREVMPSPRPLGPSPALQEAEEKERCMDRDMLKSFYPPPLTGATPVDYPRKAIGACPYSKEQSRQLPMADAPVFALFTPSLADTPSMPTPRMST